MAKFLGKDHSILFPDTCNVCKLGKVKKHSGIPPAICLGSVNDVSLLLCGKNNVRHDSAIDNPSKSSNIAVALQMLSGRLPVMQLLVAANDFNSMIELKR